MHLEEEIQPIMQLNMQLNPLSLSGKTNIMMQALKSHIGCLLVVYFNDNFLYGKTKVDHLENSRLTLDLLKVKNCF